jgi:predicted permease
MPMSLELSVDDRTERSLVVLGAAVAFLLLIVCANLASLALSRSLARARDLAVRAALGASRADLVRQSFVESLLLGASGAVAGAILAGLLLSVARAVMPDAVTLSTLNPIDLDGRTLACAAVLGMVTAMLFGLPPAYFASRTAISDVLRRGGRAIAGVGASERLRAALVIAEVGVSMVLLVGAALMTHSLVRLTRADRGLDATGLIALRLGLPAASYADPSVRDQFTRLVSERLRHVPGVQAVSIGSVPPETSKVVFGQVHVDGLPEEAGDPAIVPVYEVTPDFFATLRIPIERGHTFTDHDPEQPAIVSESFAHQHWPSGTAIGGRFEIGQTGMLTVIGIVGDVRRVAPGEPTRTSQIYYPVGQTKGLGVPAGRVSTIADYRTLVIRADDPARVVPSLPAAVHEIDPLVVIWKTDLVEHLFADAIARPRVVFVLMTMFATFGLVLAAAGIYGVLSYLVAARQQEIGIRLALGARPQRVGMAIVRNGLTLTVVGLVVGLAAALMLVQTMRTLLYEVEPSDPVSIAAVAAVLLATALLACWRPMRQAMRVDPVNLLREG